MGSRGSSCWADWLDLLAGVNQPGILLGQLPSPRLSPALRLLIKAPAQMSGPVCEVALAALQRKPLPYSARGTVHAAFFMPAGAGKSQAIAIPFLRSSPHSAVVLDVKAELFKATAEARRRMGHDVIAIDPWGLVGPPSEHCLNPLDLVDKGFFALDDIRALADAIVVKSPKETEPHWNQSAELMIGGVTAAVKGILARGVDLSEVAEVISDPKELKKVIRVMQLSPAYNGLLARWGNSLTHFQEKELDSVLTTCLRHLAFLNTPAVMRSVGRTTFDVNRLSEGKQTVYMIMPPDLLESQAGLLRLWVTTFLRATVRSGLKDKPIYYVLDEAAALSKLDAIESAITQLRGYGARFLMFYQSLGQLKKQYEQGQEQTFLSNMSLTVFASVNDYETAEAVSKRLGNETIRLHSASGGSSSNRNRDSAGMDSYSSSSNDGWSVSEEKRELLQPAEVCALPPDTAICFQQGLPPALVNLVPAYSPKFKLPRPTPLLRRCFAFALLSVSCAAVLSFALLAQLTETKSKQPIQQKQPLTKGVKR